MHCHVVQAWNWPVVRSIHFGIAMVYVVHDFLVSHKPDRWHDEQDLPMLLSPALLQSPIVRAIYRSMFVPFSNHQPLAMLHINSIFDWTRSCPRNRMFSEIEVIRMFVQRNVRRSSKIKPKCRNIYLLIVFHFVNLPPNHLFRLRLPLPCLYSSKWHLTFGHTPWHHRFLAPNQFVSFDRLDPTAIFIQKKTTNKCDCAKIPIEISQTQM